MLYIYTLYKASDLTSIGAHQELGLQNKLSISKDVEEHIQWCNCIHEEFDEIISTRLSQLEDMQ